MMNGGLQIAGRIRLPDRLENEIEINEADCNVVYKARAGGFIFDSNDIRAYAQIMRREARQYEHNRITSIFPWRTEKVRKERWTSEETIARTWYMWGNFQAPFTADGISIRDRNRHGYRQLLVTSAANKGYMLTDRFLDLLFGPIDSKLEQIAQTLRNGSETIQNPARLAPPSNRTSAGPL